jgi:hypothetical protein
MESVATLTPAIATLHGLVQAAIARAPGSETHIISNHFQQIEDLLIGQGIDFAPESDPAGDRAPFLRRVLKETHIQSYLPDLIRKVMGTGEALLWLRYTPQGYRIRYYPREDFTPFYDPVTDDLYAAIVVSTFRESVGGQQAQKWLKIVILAEGYFVQVSDRPLKAENIGGMAWKPGDPAPLVDGSVNPAAGEDIRWVPSPFSFLPIVVAKNKPTGPAGRGADDFSEFASQIVSHDRTTHAIARNVRKFARNTIFTNLDRNQIMRSPEGGERNPGRYGDSPLYAAGYRSAGQMQGSGEGEEEVSDVIGVDGQPGENFITPIEWNPIQSDQLSYLKITEEKLHWSMGSVADRGGGTAFEVRANLSWSTATANKKALGIFTNGVCRLLEMAIAHEENIFVATNGKSGLVPAGDRSVRWRRIELIQPSPQDQLQLSILGRNLEEEGVGTVEILKILFPDKTTKEIEAMTGGAGGIPFRKMDKTIPQLQNLYNTILALPPELGVALLPIADLLITNLTEAINYGRNRTPDPASPGDSAPNPANSLSAILTTGAAADAATGRMDGMGSISVGADVPAPGTAATNPISAAFGKLTNWERSPIARALGIVGGNP